jgi:hypothetical protein
MNIVVSTVNRSRSLNHRQFQELLIDIEADYGDVLYHAKIQWLSRGKVLKKIYDLRKEVQLFMDIKGKPLLEFSDEDWILDYAFLVDVTQHLDDLNLQLRGRSQLVNDIFACIKAFEVKLCLWEVQLTKQNTVHFPALNERAKSVSFNAAKCAIEVGVLREEFKSRFPDFRKHETSFQIFASPFELDVETVPKKFQRAGKK